MCSDKRLHKVEIPGVYLETPVTSHVLHVKDSLLNKWPTHIQTFSLRTLHTLFMFDIEKINVPQYTRMNLHGSILYV